MAKATTLGFYEVISFCLFFSFVAVVTQSAPESALVTQLPGFADTFLSKHYSGTCMLLFIPGPFNFEAAKTNGSLPQLHLNLYSWSKVSNIIYLDSPVGVGLSYSKNQSDYVTGDLQTATDTHAFLLKWFQLYSEFLSNPFFIAGESYAGVYVPTLSYEVVKGIDAGAKPVINFKGYLVGNGVADDEFDGNALVPFAHGMGLISDDLYEEVKNECRGNFYNPLSDTCESKLQKVDEDIRGLNMYDILEPCYHEPETPETADIKIRLPSSFRKLGETDRPLAVRKRMFGRAWPLRAPVRDGIVPTWPQLLDSQSVPCMDDEIATKWLNDAAVRKAIHAEEETVIGTWQLCTDNILYDHDAGSMIKYHKNLTSRGYRALIFRYLQGYENNLTFLTIKGAGHTVPEYKPREALDFYSRFLAGKAI
ncbi:Peptidase S10 [Theobroma cacao]|nr:Peptidase S10 [Theobroma cacao]